MAPRIAIIEDDPDLRDTMVDYLQSEGYPAWGVESAEFFYRRYAVEKIDIVIVDIGLPGEDGLSVTAHLHGLPELAVIIVSARGTLDDRLAGLRAGADRYLVKPVDFGTKAWEDFSKETLLQKLGIADKTDDFIFQQKIV